MVLAVDLSGPWKAAPLDAELNRSGADPDLDDHAWATISVPGHWDETDAFAGVTEPILHRRRFVTDPPAPDKRAWLRLDGVIAQSEVWLDGDYLGDTNGYFVPHQFEVSDALRARDDHLLAVEVACAPPSSTRPKQSVTGSLQTGPLAPRGNPGGIWRPVRIEQTGPAAILFSRLVCTEASANTAELRIRLVLDAREPGPHRVDTSVTGPDGTAVAGGATSHTLAQGENRIEYTVTVDQPALWWPHALGEQPLYEVAVAIRTPDNAVSDRRHWRTGIRWLREHNMALKVNGERMFTKGIVLGPQSPYLASLAPSVITDDLRCIVEAGLDLVRVHGHVARPELYQAADRLGLLVWQDLPLVGPYATSARKTARAVARSAVDLLGHHPSVAYWCAHDEPNGPPLPAPARAGEPPAPTARRLARHYAPSWNRSVLDPMLRRELTAADASRPVVTRSGSLPSVLDPASSDTHLWLGWHSGTVEDLPDLVRQWPRLATFLGGFGSQSAVVREWDEQEPTWRSAQVGSFDRYLPRRAYSDGGAWSAATQVYQAELLRYHIETIRRLKFRPAGGFCLSALADAEPDGGFGILDHERNRKPAFNAVLDACRPVVVVADPLPEVLAPGQRVQLDVHAISDLNQPLGRVRVRAAARCANWSLERDWEGDLPANGCEFIGLFEFVIPETQGSLIVDLHLLTADRAATNRYKSVIIPAAETYSATETTPNLPRPRLG